MATIDCFLTQFPDEYGNYENVQIKVLERLLNDKVITQEQFDEYTKHWHIIIVKKSWFGIWFKKILKGKTDGYIVQYVKFDMDVPEIEGSNER